MKNEPRARIEEELDQIEGLVDEFRSQQKIMAAVQRRCTELAAEICCKTTTISVLFGLVPTISAASLEQSLAATFMIDEDEPKPATDTEWRARLDELAPIVTPRNS